MFCSTQFLLKRCYLLYAFILLQFFCYYFVFIYIKYTKNKLEDMEVDMANLQEDSVIEIFSKFLEKMSPMKRQKITNCVRKYREDRG